MRSLDREGAPQAVVAWGLFRIPKGLKYVERREAGRGLEYMHLNPVTKGLARRPEDWKWSSYGNYAVDRSRLAGCPIQIDYVRVPTS